MRWINYYFPNIYEWSLKILHGKNFRERYHFIAENIETGSNVLDMGCGTGIFGSFVCNKCNYIGIDLNNEFLKAAKNKGLKVFKCNIFDFKKYSKNVDTIVICDVLHHIYPRHKTLLEKVAKSGIRKIIICEPCIYKDKKNFLEKCKIFLYALFDSDGINHFDLKYSSKWKYSKKQLKNFFINSVKFRKELILREIGKDIIAVYNLRN